MELQDKYIRFDWAVKRLLRHKANFGVLEGFLTCLLYTSPSPRDRSVSRMPSSA